MTDPLKDFRGPMDELISIMADSASGIDDKETSLKRMEWLDIEVKSAIIRPAQV